MTDPMKETLPEEIYQQVEALSERGNLLMDAGNPDGAIAEWREALNILPHPRNRWEAWAWLCASLGDAYRDKGDLPRALECFQNAAAAEAGHINPFVLISLGATLCDLRRIDEAIDPLLRAYMLEGEDIYHEYGAQYLQPLKERKLID